jgi:hypothetical protein
MIRRTLAVLAKNVNREMALIDERGRLAQRSKHDFERKQNKDRPRDTTEGNTPLEGTAIRQYRIGSRDYRGGSQTVRQGHAMASPVFPWREIRTEGDRDSMQSLL